MDLAVSRVASRAGVSTASIYRRWRSKPDMVLAAIRELILPGRFPDTGSLRADLVAYMRGRARAARSPIYRRVAPALGAEASRNPTFRRTLEEAFDSGLAAERQIFDRALARGEIRPDAEIQVARHALIGAVFHNLLQGQPTLPPERMEALVDLVLFGIAARGPNEK